MEITAIKCGKSIENVQFSILNFQLLPQITAGGNYYLVGWLAGPNELLGRKRSHAGKSSQNPVSDCDCRQRTALRALRLSRIASLYREDLWRQTADCDRRGARKL